MAKRLTNKTVAPPSEGEVSLHSWGMIAFNPLSGTSPLMGEVGRG